MMPQLSCCDHQCDGLRPRISIWICHDGLGMVNCPSLVERFDIPVLEDGRVFIVTCPKLAHDGLMGGHELHQTQAQLCCTRCWKVLENSHAGHRILEFEV
eukprot:4146281-Amphidinium_carterae.1